MSQKTNKISISCIIPTRNRPLFLKEALDSVLKQTVKPHEIIIVNSGSEPVESSEGIKIFDVVKNSGPSQARNFGACVASGDFLAFLDDDDLWPPDYLERVTHALRQDTLCVISRLDKLENGKVQPYKYAEKNMRLIYSINPGITGSNVVVDRELFISIGGFDVRLESGEDKSLIIDLMDYGQKNAKSLNWPGITFLLDNFAIQRMHDGPHIGKTSKGIKAFVDKYSDRMTRMDYYYNMSLISKNPCYRLAYLCHKLLSDSR